APDPGRDSRHSAFQGRRKPAIATFSIRKTWLAVPRLALSAIPANSSALKQRLLDGIPPMGDLRCPYHLPRPIIDNRQPACFTSGIDLDPQFLYLWAGDSFFQDDSEGVAMKNRRLPLRE